MGVFHTPGADLEGSTDALSHWHLAQVFRKGVDKLVQEKSVTIVDIGREHFHVLHYSNALPQARNQRQSSHPSKPLHQLLSTLPHPVPKISSLHTLLLHQFPDMQVHLTQKHQELHVWHQIPAHGIRPDPCFPWQLPCHSLRATDLTMRTSQHKT